MERFNKLLLTTNDTIWTYILIPMLIGIGIYFTFRGRGIQFRYIGEMFRLLGDGIGKKSKGISSFGAFCVSVASRVGTGNLAGVATALSIGGAGSIFWMWLIALIGSASAFVESTLAQIYKEPKGDSFVGGPAYYIEKGLNKRWLGVLFAIIISITFGMFFNSVQSNTITLAFKSSFDIDRATLGAVVSLLSMAVIFGGIKRITLISSIIVPIMAVGYILLVLYIVITNISLFGDVISQIIDSAFGLRQAVAGGVGAAIMQGVKRGLFSNEAGMGSAPNAAATATVSHPAKQGFIQALGVFMDTIVICSCTAFMILISGAPLDGSIKGIELTQYAMDQQIAGYGNLIISIFILFFAFSSIIGNYYYGEANITFITRKKIYLNIYRIVVVAMVFWGSIASLDTVWSIADVSMAVMTFVNLIAIVLLSKIAFDALADYIKQKKAGIKSPIYKNSEFDVWK